MKPTQPRRHGAAAACLRRLLLAGLALALVSCGGGSSAPQAAAPNLVDDSATVTWNAPSTIDVLGNDAAGDAAVTLTTVSKPAHGQASIAAGKVVYTPDPGYFGVDTLTYTASAGGATASAKLSLTVEAAIQLEGAVSDGPIPQANVVVTVGSASFSGVADAQGRYSVALRSANGADFIAVQASGVGAQAKVKLMSRLGTLAALAGRVSPSNELSTREGAATHVDHVTTALATLAKQAHGGTAPTTQPEWEAALDSVAIEAMLDAATAIKLVVDAGVDLPAGVSDTLALVDSQSALAAFVAGQAQADPSRFKATRQAVIDAEGGALTVPVVASSPRTLVFFAGRGPADSAGVQVVTFAANGTASVLSELGTQAARWTSTDGVIDLRLDQPFSTQAWDVADGEPMSVFTDAFSFRLIAGSLDNGIVQQVTSASKKRVVDPKAGILEPVSRADVPAVIVRVMDLERRLPLVSSEFATGSRLAGPAVTTPMARQHPYAFTLYVLSGPEFEQQVLSFDTASSATVHGATSVPWSVADNWMKLGARSYARLRVDTATGEERWLGVDDAGGSASRAMEMPVVKAGPPVIVARSDLARQWRSRFVATEAGSYLRFKLFADGTGLQLFATDGSPGSTALTWSQGPGGEAILSKPHGSSGATQERVWAPLQLGGGKLWVLETVTIWDSAHVVPQVTGGPKIQLFADEGPAGG